MWLTRTARVLAILLTTVLATACGGGDDGPSSSPTAPSTPSAPFSQTDLRVGTGTEAVAGRTLTVNYTGWLYDPGQAENKGRQFDSSAGRQPFAFRLGAGGVIRGWDQGLVGMRVGGQRRLVIPPDLAYGSQGAGNGAIPPNATLVFDVELLDVQ
jgi:FKBP-type peptidyl-prolyl cis-trans isomerase FkpA